MVDVSPHAGNHFILAPREQGDLGLALATEAE
jgi:hypothetical protein